MARRAKPTSDALAQLGLRTAGVAHDLAQPLTAALLAARQIEGKGAPQLRAALHRMEDLLQAIRSEMHPSTRRGSSPMADLARIGADLTAGLTTSERRRTRMRLSGKLRADASALGRIVGNLVLNALRHGQGPVEATGSARGGKLSLVVTGGAGKTTSETGWGIGLASSQDLATQHGFTLTVEISPQESRATLVKKA